MAKKKTTENNKKGTKTRASQYDARLKMFGEYSLQNCDIISFKFEDEGKSHNFHYSIMGEGLSPLIYDGPKEIVRIVILKNDILKSRFIELAEKIGYIDFKECLPYNDYE